jgi:hypothetical protein
MPDLLVPVKEFQPFPWQLDFLKKFDNNKFNFAMLNWHRRAMKTTMSLNLLIREAVRNPKSSFYYIGPTYKQAKSITWLDPQMLPRYLPRPYIKRKNESDLLIEFKNDTIFRLLGGDDPDTIRGTNGQGYIIDEWSVFSDPDIWPAIIRPILTRKISQGERAWCIFTFTPRGRNHTYNMWNDCENWDGWYKSILTVEDSKLMGEKELKQAQKEMTPALFRQEYYCDFIADDERVVIPYDTIIDLNRNVYTDDDPRIFVVCDPSGGGDECPIFVFRGTELIDQKILIGERNPMVVTGEIVNMTVKYQTPDIVIDANGLGEGIAFRLKEQGKNVIMLRGQHRIKDDERYLNQRAEMYFYTLHRMVQHKIHPIEDRKIINQLTAVRYEPSSSGKIKLEPKDALKKRFGQSPDRSDCYVMGIYGLKFLKRRKNTGLDFGRGQIRARKEKSYKGSKRGW